MKVKGIGINADSTKINGNLDVLREDLDYFIQTGYDYAEIPIHGLDLLLNGKLNKFQLNEVKNILKKYPLKYTVHSADNMNLMNCYSKDTHKAAFYSTIDFADEIGSNVVIYHSSNALFTQKTLFDYYYPNYGKKSVGRLFEILCEEDACELFEIGEYAKKKGIVIAVENIWYENLENIYTYGAFADDLVNHIKKVNHPNVGILYDFGHAYINSKIYGFDFIESVKKVVPYLKHIHVHDNFGKADRNEKYIERLPFGYGDLHLPLGFGEIPYKDAVLLLNNYEGVFTLEIHPRFREYLSICLKEAEKLSGYIKGADS